MRPREVIQAAWCRMIGHSSREQVRVQHETANGVRVDQLAIEECLDCPRVIRVSRAQVYAARARRSLDIQNGRPTEEWVKRLAAVDLERLGRRGVM